MQLEGYGLAPGCRADFVLFQAQDPVEAARLRATRLGVFRSGKLVVQPRLPRLYCICRDGREKQH
jgi:cytosine/creatinine deaminase